MWDAGADSANLTVRRQCHFYSAAACSIPVLHRLWPERAVCRSVPTNFTTKSETQMITSETRVQIRHHFYANHWKIGTIARELNVHPDAVRNAIESDRFNRTQPMGQHCITDPYMSFVRQTLDQHPQLRATRIYQMIRERGYNGSVVQLRRVVARLRPPVREAFLRLHAFPADQAQVDWAHFGQVAVGRARRTLSCFVMTLSWSRALYLEFFFDQTMENFLRGHVHAFEAWAGQPRVILYDNLKSAVLERRGSEIHFNPRLMELCAHYHFVARPCQVRAGNQKGRVERAIRYIRESFWAGRPFTTLAECNRQALLWRDNVAHQRRWPGDDSRTVAQAFAEEQPRLLPPPVHSFPTDLVVPVRSAKTIYVRFDLNDYSIPPEAVGRQLTVAASDTAVRILDGATEVACHRRTYDRHHFVLDPNHQQALLTAKRKAFESTPSGRLASLVPESNALIDLAFSQGESAGSQTAHLLKLLDQYGVAALRRAIAESLERNTPRASSVAFLLGKRQRSAPAPAAVDLSRHPAAQSVDVRPHDLETYDELSRHKANQ